MATAIGEAFVTVRPDVSEFGPELQREARGALEGVSRNLTSAGASLTATVTAPLIGLGTAALASFNSVDQGLATIRRGTGETGDALRALESDFEAVARSGPDAIGQAAEAIAGLNTELALTGEPLQEAARAALDVSRIMEADLNTVIREGSNLLGLFNEDASEFTGLLDSLTVAAQRSGVPLQQLVSTTQTYGPVLRNVGFSLEETVAFMAAFEGAGIDISRIMPGLNAATRRWAQEGIEDISGALTDAIEQIRDAETSTEALRIATDTFGAEGAQRMVTAIRNNVLELDDFIAALNDADGAVADTARESRTFAEDFAELRHEIPLALAPLGQSLVGALRNLLPLFSTAAETLRILVEQFANLPTPVQTVAIALGAIAAAAGPVLISIGLLAPGLASVQAAALGAAGGMQAFNLALLASPAGLAALGVGLVAGGAAAIIFGSALSAANDEMERTARVASIADAASTQSTEQLENSIAVTQEYRNELAQQIQALEEVRAATNPASQEFRDMGVELRALQEDLSHVDEELLGFQTALDQARESERLFEDAMGNARDMADDLAGSVRGLGDEFSTLTPRMVASAGAARILAIESERGIRRLIELGRVVNETAVAAERVAELEDMTDFILSAAGVAEELGSVARSAGGVGRSADAARGEVEEFTRSIADMGAQARATLAAEQLLAQGIDSVEGAMEAIHPAAVQMIRDLAEQEELTREVADAILGVQDATNEANQDGGFGGGNFLGLLASRRLAAGLDEGGGLFTQQGESRVQNIGTLNVNLTPGTGAGFDMPGMTVALRQSFEEAS